MQIDWGGFANNQEMEDDACMQVLQDSLLILFLKGFYCCNSKFKA